ncbi:UNKNOWN [Stylonychia lemnae]|uniref:Coiled-coil domain-containing protein 22 homolog n=1 Tax=Stylonychia lemnae TaxID=5949 RepID=A0A078B1L5_STYLE|nr:UNKNOWN [Stylonychia lemnae]|eukprot:CDW88196.1 UNKNOWN [Stylonychia lemnae]
MEEADNILIISLQHLGIQAQNLNDFSAEQFIVIMIKCFEQISSMLSEKDNFIDIKFLKSQNLKEATHRFKVCNQFTTYLKTLGYYHDLSFNAFLYPNPKDTRKLLGFLFEFIFKAEDDQDNKNNQPTNEFEVLLKRRLGKWQNKPWILPDFLKIKRPLFIGGGDRINVKASIDYQRIAQCKSKKAKGVYELMMTFKNGEMGENYQSGQTILSNELSSVSFKRGQVQLLQKKGNNLIRGEDEEDYDERQNKNQKRIVRNSKAKIIQEFQTAIQTLTKPGAAIAAQEERDEQVKTLKEVLEEREEQLKDMEQLQDLKSAQYIERLNEDIGESNNIAPQTTTANFETQSYNQPQYYENQTYQEEPFNNDLHGNGRQKFNEDYEERSTFSQMNESVDQKDFQFNQSFQTSNTMESTEYGQSQQNTERALPQKQYQQSAQQQHIIAELQQKFDVNKLKEEKEAEIQVMVEQIDNIKQDIENYKTTYERNNIRKQEISEEKKDLTENLKKISKQAKKKKEVLNELQKLGNQDLRVLQTEVSQIKKELDDLKSEWEEYKKPINEEIFEKKQEINEKRIEYQYKNEKIKNIKKEIKEAIQEIEHKKQLASFMEQEFTKIPKDLNRNQYLKRIYEIIANVKAQKVEIKTILDEIKDIQSETEKVMTQIKKIDTEVEDFIFNEAKKDKTATNIYKEIMRLKENFDKLITNIQEQNKLKNGIREVETKLEDFRIKYKNMEEINKLEADLNSIRKENMDLKRQLGQN